MTPSSKASQNGELALHWCSKKQKADGKKPPAKKRGPGIGRRQESQANLLDGLAPHGTLETC